VRLALDRRNSSTADVFEGGFLGLDNCILLILQEHQGSSSSPRNQQWLRRLWRLSHLRFWANLGKEPAQLCRDSFVITTHKMCVVHRGSRVHMPQSLLPNFHRRVQTIKHSGVTVTKGVHSSLQFVEIRVRLGRRSQLRENRLEMPFHKVIRVKANAATPAAFLRQAQRSDKQRFLCVPRWYLRRAKLPAFRCRLDDSWAVTITLLKCCCWYSFNGYLIGVFVYTDLCPNLVLRSR
jgi:hypothetical protein